MTDQLPALPYPKPTAQIEPYVEAFGIELAITFLLQFGGAELYVAKDPRGRSQLEALVGPERAKALGANDHRLQRRVPLAKPWLAACFATLGMGTAEIARTLRVSDTSVRKWLK